MEYWTRYCVFWFTMFFITGTVSAGGQCTSACTDCADNNTCLNCEDGYYISNNDCVQCPYKCKTCTHGSYCDTCKPGFWNWYCNWECNLGCAGNECSIASGDCTCKPGFHGTKCNRNCSSFCINKMCSDIDGSCECAEGYFGVTCKNTCMISCKDCDDGSQCTLCPVGKYGLMCSNVCDCNGGSCDLTTGQCDDQPTCTTHCTECSGTGVCTACQTGFYGSQCELCSDKCTNDSNGGCEFNTGTCYACQDGYYGLHCNQQCQNCNDLGCHKNGTCYQCLNKNMFGLNCNIQCSSLCMHDTCDRWTGNCPLKCHSRCEVCDSNTGICIKCQHNNRYGNNCQFFCNDGCLNSTCNQRTGECFECNNGFGGPFCNVSCSTVCSSSRCDRESGKCIECANQTLYGDYCDTPCSENCKDRQCDRSGVCTSGCVINQYSHRCQLKCSETCKAFTIDSRCDDLVRCLEGCVQGYTGEDCKTVTSTDETPLGGDADLENRVAAPGPHVAAIGGGVGGLAFLIVVVVLVVVLLRRRQRNLQKEAATPNKDLNNEYHTIDIVPEANKRLSIRSNGVRETSVAATSEYELEDVVAPPKAGGDEEEADKYLEIDDDEARRCEKRRVAPSLEENVYYISHEEIQKRKVRVSDLPAFVADKTMTYYEEEFDKFPEGITQPANAATSPNNVGKNRYKGLYAYDNSRVKVAGFNTDYINANYIDGFRERNAYIASLGPMKKQMGDYGVFWAMVWQQKVEKIVMVTNLKEEGRDKCEQYWPSPGQSHVYGGVKVTCQRELIFAEFTRRQFVLNMGSTSRQVHHLHFTAWPDKGIPDDVTTLVEFRQRVLNAPSALEGPTLVHCSAGIGRTGTFIALDSLTREGEAEGAVEIPGCIINMRQNRTNMVQTAEQYEFLHHALVHTLTLACAQIPADTFSQYMATTTADDFAQQFKKLSETDHIVSDEEISATEHNKSEQNKNRQGADIPGDAHRPHLYLGIGPQQSGYINAVYINSLRCRRRFLLAQTPLPGTVVDFLTMAFQENCVAIVNFQEDSDIKDVGTYSPADNQVLQKGKFTVHSSKVNGSHQQTIQRELMIAFSGVCTGDKTRKIQHYVFTDWDAKRDVPGSPERFVAFIEKTATLSGGPILLHCRNGGGRSGLFCAVASLLEKVKVERNVSVVNAVRRVKARRSSAIHCQAQFNFCHQCVLCHINSDNDYVN